MATIFLGQCPLTSVRVFQFLSLPERKAMFSFFEKQALKTLYNKLQLLLPL